MAKRLTDEERDALDQYELMFAHLVDGALAERVTSEQRDLMRRLGWSREKFVEVRRRLRALTDKMPADLRDAAIDELIRIREAVNEEFEEFQLTDDELAEIEANVAAQDRSLISASYVAMKSRVGMMLRAARAAQNDPRLN